jgi:hypothetical protein
MGSARAYRSRDRRLPPGTRSFPMPAARSKRLLTDALTSPWRLRWSRPLAGALTSCSIGWFSASHSTPPRRRSRGSYLCFMGLADAADRLPAPDPGDGRRRFQYSGASASLSAAAPATSTLDAAPVQDVADRGERPVGELSQLAQGLAAAGCSTMDGPPGPALPGRPGAADARELPQRSELRARRG